MSSVVANQPGFHWLGSTHAYSGAGGQGGAGHTTSGQTQAHSPPSSHANHGMAVHGPSRYDGSQNGSLGQHVNTKA